MTPVDFPGRNVIFGAGQPEYLPLPAILIPGVEGEVITCWEMTDEELAEIIKTKRFYLSQYCFTRVAEDGQLVNNPLQPIRPMVDLSDSINFL